MRYNTPVVGVVVTVVFFGNFEFRKIFGFWDFLIFEICLRLASPAEAIWRLGGLEA